VTAQKPTEIAGMRKRTGILRAETINMSHGGGGKAMRDLIEDVFLQSFDNEELSLLEDQARVDLSTFTALGNRLAMTTDSYVVDPISSGWRHRKSSLFVERSMI